MQPALNKASGREKVKGHIRREQIVRASLNIIAEKGVGSLTTSAIARESGISEANLYRHFKNKEEIYSAAVEHVKGKIAKNLEKAMSAGSNPAAKLKRFFSLQIGLMQENSGILRLLFSEELHMQPAMRKIVLDTMYSIAEKLTSLVRDGQKNGLLRNDIDPVTTIMMFVAMIQGIAFRWSLSGFSFSLKSEGMKAWRNFEKCICATGEGMDR